MAGKKGITDRQRLYLDIRTKNPSMSKKDAARLAGFSESTSTYRIESGQVKAVLARLIRGRCPAHLIAQRIAEGLEANEVKFFQYEGVVTDAKFLVNWSERREYAKMAADLGYGMNEREKSEGTSNNVVAQSVIIMNGVTKK